jgi:hypothetical protein
MQYNITLKMTIGGNTYTSGGWSINAPPSIVFSKPDVNSTLTKVTVTFSDPVPVDTTITVTDDDIPSGDTFVILAGQKQGTTGIIAHAVLANKSIGFTMTPGIPNHVNTMNVNVEMSQP